MTDRETQERLFGPTRAAIRERDPIPAKARKIWPTSFEDRLHAAPIYPRPSRLERLRKRLSWVTATRYGVAMIVLIAAIAYFSIWGVS